MSGDENDNRRHPRYEVPLKGTLHVRDDDWPCTVRNISVGGALVEADAPLRVGHLITVDIDEIGRLKGRVTRTIWKFAGLALEEGEKRVEAFLVEWLANEPEDSESP